MENYDAKQTYDSIPEYEQYVSNILDFDKRLTSYTYDFEVLEDFYETCVLFPANIYQNKFIGRRFFRVRPEKRIDAKENKELVKTYSYPPVEFCKPNRGNADRRSVFYCSDESVTTFYESRLKAGDYGYLSIWECIADKPLSYNCILPSSLRSSNRWTNHLPKENYSILSDIYGKKRQEEYLNNYIANKYVEEIEPYILTSSLSEVILYSNNHVDFMVYPSYQTNGEKCNIAFHPNSVDKYLKCIEIIKVRIESLRDSCVEYTIVEVGEVDNQTVKWRYANQEDSARVDKIV